VFPHDGGGLRRSVVVFGGLLTGTTSGELFKLDVQTEEWTMIKTTSGVSPSATTGHTMGSTEGFLWVFGGLTGGE
jgi:hypothetical protein